MTNLRLAAQEVLDSKYFDESCVCHECRAMRNLRDALATPEPGAVNCREAGPGRGLCDFCARGEYEKCRYVNRDGDV